MAEKTAVDPLKIEGLPLDATSYGIATGHRKGELRSTWISYRCRSFQRELDFNCRFWDHSACNDEIIPLQERIETVGDDADLQEVYDTERHLLYVACTRARDHLLITSVVQVLTLVCRGGKARA